jgi:hypothetical protein
MYVDEEKTSERGFRTARAGSGSYVLYGYVYRVLEKFTTYNRRK